MSQNRAPFIGFLIGRGSIYTAGTGTGFLATGKVVTLRQSRHRHFPNPNPNLQNTLQKSFKSVKKQ